MFVRDYAAWTHPAGGRVYMVFAVPGGAPTGIVFEVDHGASGVPHMCGWCHAHGGGSQIALLTTYVNAQKRVGINVCADLSCKAKLNDEADRTGRSALPAMQKLMATIGRFASESLGIDLSAAGR